MDGFPLNQNKDNVLGCDLRSGYIKEGYALYGDGPTSESPTPIRFFTDDIFDITPSPDDTTTTDSVAAPDERLSLKALLGKVEFIHTGLLFHLFNEETQVALAERLVMLLNTSFEEGRSKEVVVFGCHQGLEVAGYIVSDVPRYRYGHSPTSWASMWKSVFKRKYDEEWVERHVTIEAKTGERRGISVPLFWSVTVR